MHEFSAILMRERFTLTPRGKPEKRQTALGNRLDFRCSDSRGEKEARFIVRAQNIHTCLRIGARIAAQWYEYGHIHSTGRNRFIWGDVYKDAVMDFEKKWNEQCWASAYKNGRLLFHAGTENKNELLDVIEQVHAFKRGDYKSIAEDAEEIFAQARRKVVIDYDCNLALDLHGSRYSVQNNMVYRDNDGRNTIAMQVRQRELKYVPGAKGAYIKLSECLSLTAAVFEGFQLGFVIGKTQHRLASGAIRIGHRDAVHADHAIQRLNRLHEAVEQMKTKYFLMFDPKPDFYGHAKRVEASLKTGKTA